MSFPSLKGSPASSSTSTACANISANPRRPRTISSGCCSRPRRNLRPSTPISAASITSARSSALSAAPTTPSSITSSCARKSRSALAEGKGPVTPDGDMGKERYRLVVEGPPNYTNFRQFWKMFYDEGAVVVASSYTKVGGTYDFGFRHDPDKPLESLAEYCLDVYTNRNLPMRVDMLRKYIERVRGGRTADQFDQELQQLLGRPAADDARGREAHRQARALHRNRSGRSRAISRPPTSRTGSKAISR